MSACNLRCAAIVFLAAVIPQGKSWAGDFYWSGGPAGWLTSANWGGTAPSLSGDIGHLASGQADTTSTTFPSILRIEGTDGVGGALYLPSNATAADVQLAGGKVWWTTDGGSSRTLASSAGSITVVAATRTTVTATGAGSRTLTLNPLAGTGGLLVTNIPSTSNFPLKDSPSFGGTIDVYSARLVKDASFNLGSGGTIRLYAGGVLDHDASSGTWTIPGGLVLHGGEFRDSGNNVVTLSTPVSISAASKINMTTSSTTGTTISGIVSGSATLDVMATGTRTLKLSNTGNLYSGTVNVGAAATLLFSAAGAEGSARVVLADATSGLALDASGTPNWTLSNNDIGGVGTVKVEDGAGSRVLTFKGGKTLGPGTNTTHTGTLTVQGGLTLGDATTAGMLAVEVGGASAGQFDVLDLAPASGSPTLTLAKAELMISLCNGFKPTGAETFKIVNVAGANAVVGTFATVTPPPGYRATVNYAGGDNANDIVIAISRSSGTVILLF